MRILLVDLPSLIIPGVRDRLSPSHELIMLDGATLDREACAAHAEVDLVIHGAQDRDDPATMIDTATRGTWNLLTTTSARRYLQLSTLRLLDDYHPGWAVDEAWAPRPDDDPVRLSAHLAELVSREVARTTMINAKVLRLDRVLAAADFDRGPTGPDWLHVDDAVGYTVRAAETLIDEPDRPGWTVLHAVRGPGRFRSRGDLGFRPAHPGDPTPVDPSPQPPAEPGPVRAPAAGRAVIFGAGGPLGASAAEQLAAVPGLTLTLTDVRPLAELAARPPQSPNAPLPAPARPPHTELLVDVTNQDQVRQAAAGADCLINCTVIRHEADAAFRVNVLGAYAIMRAAVAHGIRRVVQTGPAQVLLADPIGYASDRAVRPDTPARSGSEIYFLSKLLGSELCRIFAERYGIATPVLLFESLIAPDAVGGWTSPFMISWPDAGRAIRAAATVPELPEPCPVLHVRAPSPHGRYRADGLTEVLRWQPEDRLDHRWIRSTPGAPVD